MTKLIPCKHLDYEGEYHACTIRTCAPHYPNVRYWERGEVWTEGGTNPSKVQFCKLRGRINGVSGCYNGEMYCYEPVIEDGKVEA